MNAEIITIGNEILFAHTDNTNAPHISRALSELGIATRWITVVGDEVSDIIAALRQGVQRADILLSTGGLGPTHDDVTKTAVTELLGTGLVKDNRTLERIRSRFTERGVVMARINEDQALVPAAAGILANSVGTAPGFTFKLERALVFMLPGVPREMRAMMAAEVIPALKRYAPGRCIRQRVLRTTGIPESSLFEKLGDIKKIEENVRLAFLPSVTGVTLRLSVEGETENECQRRLAAAEEKIRAAAGDFIYGSGGQKLEEVVAALLFSTGATIAVAESCTGGLLANLLTNVSGSSRYFERGVIAYSNLSKQELLGIPARTLSRFGAVSPQVATAMAEGVRRAASVDMGIATTGIAGPTGGTPVKPVGLVFIGFADANGSFVRRYTFAADRLFNKRRAAVAALELLRRQLSGLEIK